MKLRDAVDTDLSPGLVPDLLRQQAIKADEVVHSVGSGIAGRVRTVEHDHPLARTGQDERGLPVELSGILERLSKAKIKVPILERGDKKRIKEALQTLRS